MKHASARCGFFSKSNVCVLIAISAGWVSASQLRAETIAGGSDVEGNFTIGTTSTKGKLTVKAPNSVALDEATLGLEVQSAGGVYFGTSAIYGTQTYLPSSVSNGFYYSASLGSIQLGQGLGYSTGTSSFTSGYYATAAGDNSISVGTYTSADGESSAAFNNSFATGEFSFSANFGQAVGDWSFAAGNGTIANSYSSAVFGAYNKAPTANATAWVSTDPLFTIGNGTDTQTSNALIVQKNGVANFYAFGAASTNPAIVLDPTGTTPSITVGGQKVVTSTSAGNVGIGTTSPMTNLDIASTSGTSALRIRGTTPSAEIADMFVTPSGNFVISTTAGTDADRYLDLRSADDNYGLILRDSSGANEASWANFYMKDAAVDYLNIVVGQQSWAPGLVVTAQNRVGIGTLTPQYKLDVPDYSSLGGLRINGNDEANTFLNTNGKQISINATAGNGITVKTTGAVVVGEWNVGALQKFNVMGKSYFSDWVGVGMGTPAAPLHAVLDDANSSTTGTALIVEHRTTGTAAPGLGTAIEFRGERGDGNIQNQTSKIVSLLNSNPATTVDLWDMAFYTRNDDTIVESMRLAYNGNVGIGTSTPTAKLEVAGTVKFAKQGDIPMGEFGLNGD